MAQLSKTASSKAIWTSRQNLHDQNTDSGHRAIHRISGHHLHDASEDMQDIIDSVRVSISLPSGYGVQVCVWPFDTTRTEGHTSIVPTYHIFTFLPSAGIWRGISYRLLHNREQHFWSGNYTTKCTRRISFEDAGFPVTARSCQGRHEVRRGECWRQIKRIKLDRSKGRLSRE